MTVTLAFKLSLTLKLTLTLTLHLCQVRELSAEGGLTPLHLAAYSGTLQCSESRAHLHKEYISLVVSFLKLKICILLFSVVLLPYWTNPV